MMPFVLDDEMSLPMEFRPYWEMIEQCLLNLSVSQGELAGAIHATVGKVAILLLFVIKGHRSFDENTVDEVAYLHFSISKGYLARAIQATVDILAFLLVSVIKGSLARAIQVTVD